MDKKTLNIILAILLIAAFFLPYISISGYLNASGFNVVFGKDGMAGLVKGGRLLLVCLLVPVGAIIVLFDSLGTGNSSLDYGYWMPLVGIIVLSVLMFTGMQSAAGGGPSFGEFLQIMGYGYWITLVASILLLVNKKRTA